MSLPRFAKHLEKIASRYGSYLEVLTTFVNLCACCLAIPAGDGKTVREAEYMEIVGKLKREDLDLYCEAFGELQVEMEQRPYEDLLGLCYEEWNGKWSRSAGGEFFTPTDVCRLISRMTINREMFEEDKAIRILEPCCGSGRPYRSLSRKPSVRQKTRRHALDHLRARVLPGDVLEELAHLA